MNDELYFKRMTYLLLNDWCVSRVSLYDEEGVEGWEWEHPYEHECCGIGDWSELPTMPEILEEIADKLIEAKS